MSIKSVKKHKHFLKPDVLSEHQNDFDYIEESICTQLSEYENFDGIDFCDVGANGIQIRGFHKKVGDYTYGDQPTIKYDFSNIEEVITEFVEMWKAQDNPAKLNSYLSFIYWGEKYGWD